MRAKQILATMSHEIRSPLSGVVSMEEILSTTKLDKDQKELLRVMLSSGDLVLQLINDILDLSKVESGVMKLEATKFRPREVINHVLQTAAASLKRMLILEGHVADDVPLEKIGEAEVEKEKDVDYLSSIEPELEAILSNPAFTARIVEIFRSLTSQNDNGSENERNERDEEDDDNNDNNGDE